MTHNFPATLDDIVNHDAISGEIHHYSDERCQDGQALVLPLRNLAVRT